MLTNLEVSQGLGDGETSNPGDFLWMTMTYHDIPWLLKQADWGSSDWPGVTSARGPPWRLCRCFSRCPPDPFDAENLELSEHMPIGSMYAIYMVTFTMNIPRMLAYIYQHHGSYGIWVPQNNKNH